MNKAELVNALADRMGGKRKAASDALEAVIADLRTQSPDVVVVGGDLVGCGSRPAEVIDRIRDLGWPTIQGNTDEALWNPSRFDAFFAALPQLPPCTHSPRGRTSGRARASAACVWTGFAPCRSPGLTNGSPSSTPRLAMRGVHR